MTGESGSEELLKRVGAAIAAARKRAGLTQASVANSMSVDKQTISRLETGAIAPTVHRLSQFAELFQCPISSLFGEHQAAAGEDARAVSALIADLAKEDRQTVMRLVSDVASIAREKAAWRHRSMALEREALLGAARPVGGRRRPKPL